MNGIGKKYIQEKKVEWSVSVLERVGEVSGIG